MISSRMPMRAIFCCIQMMMEVNDSTRYRLNFIAPATGAHGRAAAASAAAVVVLVVTSIVEK